MDGYNDWALRWLNAFMRIPATASQASAEAELQPVYRAAVRQELASEGTQPDEYVKELSHEHMSIVPASQGVHAVLDEWDEPLRILQWMTLALLLLTAINVAALLLVRGIRQNQEALIRYAVGATRFAVARLHFLETLVLSIAAGVVGLWIARWGAQLLVYLARLDRGGGFVYRPHGGALAVHWAATLATGLLVGLSPAWQGARLDLSAGLNEGALTHSGTRAQQARRLTAITYYVRTASPSLPEQTIREVVRQEAPSIGSYDVATMRSRMAEFASADRAMAVLVGAFALLALAIAAVGIYGVVAYSASLRTLEFGVRVSVGATSSDIARLVLREAVMILTGGVVLGVPLTYFGLSLVHHQLEGISFSEPAIYGGALLLLAICTLMAAVGPAARATRMNVHGALRHQ